MFDFFSPQLVKFGDGKFSVRIRKFIWVGWITEYVGKYGTTWSGHWIENNAKFNTEEEAVDAYFTYLTKIAKPKVISTIDEWDVL